MKKNLLLLLCTTLCMHGIAQTVTITGDTCTNTILKANVTGGLAKRIEWKKDSVIQMIRTTDYSYEQNGINVVTGIFSPQSVCVDKSGFIYVSGVSAIYKWAPGADTGIIVAGGNDCGLAANQICYAEGIALDSAGNLYIAENNADEIQGLKPRVTKWAPGATQGETVAIFTNASELTDVFVDNNNNLYVADHAKSQITKWAPGATAGTVVAGGNGKGTALNQFNNLYNIFVDRDGNIYAAENGTYGFASRVMKWAPGALSGEIAAGGILGQSGASNVFSANDIFVDNNNNLFILDAQTDRVLIWKPGAKNGITAIGGYGHGAAANQVSRSVTGIYIDDSDNLYVADFFTHGVRKFMPSNEINAEFMPYSTGEYKAKAKLDDGAWYTSAVISVNSIPGSPFPIRGSANNICNDTFTYYIAPVAFAASYNWTVPANTTLISGQGTTTIAVFAGQNFKKGDLRVDAINSCGITSDYLNLQSRPTRPDKLIGPGSVNANQTGVVFYVLTPEERTGYSWTFPSGVVVVSGQGTSTITVNWGTIPGNVAVFATNDCGDTSNNYKNKYVNVRNSFIAGWKANAETEAINIKQKDLVIYPNPAKDILNIQVSGKVSVSLISQLGKTLITATINNQGKLNIAHLPAGLYYLKNHTTGTVQKVMVSK